MPAEASGDATAATTRRPLAIADIEGEALPPTLKGLPRVAVGRPLDALGTLGLSILSGELPYPVAVLKESALAHNLAWMRDFTTRAGVSLCPHGKTTMAPQLFERQVASGAWGITAATASHVRTYRRFGVPRIVLANQLVGAANIDLVLDELDADPALDFYALVDSLAGLEALRDAVASRPLGRPLQLLLEVGAAGGRSGVRTIAEGIEIGRAARDASGAIALRGVEAFEGIFGGDAPTAEHSVHALLETVVEIARIGCEERWFAPGEWIVSAGGSAFFDIAAAVLSRLEASRPPRVVLRSGCYLTHDALMYARMTDRMRERSATALGAGPALRNALEVWAEVQSIPEPTRAICGLGKRDISHDLTLPQPLGWFRPGVHAAVQAVPDDLRVTALYDQHACVDGRADIEWRVGDLVAFGVGHPCTTFDKWPLLYVVDDGYAVIGGVRTFF